MLETVGMSAWDINLLEETDCVSAIMDRALAADRYQAARRAAQPAIAGLRETTMEGIRRFRTVIEAQTSCRGRG
jgi:hypothetical protein